MRTRWIRRVSRLGLALVLCSVAWVAFYRFVNPPITPLMVIRWVEARAAGRPAAIDRQWRPLAALGTALPRAVIASEDARFFAHHGVDLEEVERSRLYNERHHGRRVRGASTISMQCARNVFLWPGRSWLRKAVELYFTGLIELLWSKQRILEVYLNVIEWGDGVYGAEAAAEHWFRVPAARLGARQAALLAAMLPSPRRSDPTVPSAYLSRQARVVEARAARTRLPAR